MLLLIGLVSGDIGARPGSITGSLMRFYRSGLSFTSCSTLFLALLVNQSAAAEDTRRLKLATTTSMDNSGLLSVINPAFEDVYGVKVDVISVGTGKAIRLGENGDVDLILVHAPAAEKRFVERGSGIERRSVMHNDFVIIGPESDPAGISGADSLEEAMQLLLQVKHGFISRGDDSGTHRKEKQLWRTAGMQPAGDWYLSVGQGMGVVLRMADDKQSYTLADRGTYLAYKNKLSLQVLYENDESLFNPYHVILVNPENHPHVKTELARLYSGFLREKQGQDLIRNFKVNNETLFHPDVIP